MIQPAEAGPVSSLGRLGAFYHLVERAEVDSTNDEARALAEAGAPEGTLVWAHSQRKGRGRRGRNWQSPPGNLFFSLLLRPDCAPAVAAQVSFVAAVALGDALRPLLPPAARVGLKWPNDVLVNGAKIAGILLESDIDVGGATAWLVLGIGVNVRHRPDGVPYPATALAETGCSADAATLLAGFAERFADRYGRWRHAGFAETRAAWTSSAHGLGAAATVRLAQRTIEGQAVGMDEDGALLLQAGDGTTHRIAAGEVHFAPMDGTHAARD